ncbi:hypothetical protein H0N96_00015 [Candidatus Micrarchaeota archaeon]|nr:hypothetical protein [Candidatus Micrarchaeota archaeon]
MFGVFSFFMGFLDFLLPKRKPKHELKWPLPEMRLTVPLEDAEKTVGALKKAHARFASGGEFIDIVHAKQYAEGVFAYFIMRTDKKTEKETLFADAYMLQEDERLGIEVSASYSVIEDLEKLGFKKSLEREVTEWRFFYATIRVAVFDIPGLGAFLEIALPQTKFEKAREASEKTAFALLAKLGFKKEEVIPTDVITLQLLSQKQAEEQEQPQAKSQARGGREGKKKSFGGDFKLGG